MFSLDIWRRASASFSVCVSACMRLNVFPKRCIDETCMRVYARKCARMHVFSLFLWHLPYDRFDGVHALVWHLPYAFALPLVWHLPYAGFCLCLTALTATDRCGHQRQGGKASGQQCGFRHRAVPIPEEAHACARTLGLPQDVQGMPSLFLGGSFFL